MTHQIIAALKETISLGFWIVTGFILGLALAISAALMIFFVVGN